MFGTLLEVMGSTGIVIVLVVFFLVRREDLRDRFIRLVGKGDVTVTTQAIEDAATRVSRYLSMQFLLNVTFGVAVAIGLYLIGVPSAILWGILGSDFEIHSLHRRLDCRRDADWSVAGHFNGVGRTDPHDGAICVSGALHRQCHGAMALWQEHRRFSGGRLGGGRLLDLVVGSCGTAARDAA